MNSQEIVERATSEVITDTTVETTQQILDDRDAVLEKTEAIEQALFERTTPETYFPVQILQNLARATSAGGKIAEVALESAVRSDNFSQQNYD